MSNLLFRLNKELTILQTESHNLGIIIENTDDIMKWFVKIKGPINSAYEDGIFNMQLTFDDNYPIKAPSVKFLTSMYHPNIYRDGKICIDILQPHEWSPAQNVRSILLSIISLLTDPNISSPANRDAAILYDKDKNAYNQKVREYIKGNLI